MSRRPVASTRTRGLTRESSRPRASTTRATTADRGVVTDISPSHRRQRRRRVLGVALGVVLGVVTLALAGQWMLHQSFFRVQHVTVAGEQHETLAQILASSHLDAHPAMLDLSQAGIEHDLSIYPWIGSVSLVKRWPNSVDLTVHEVSAVAVAYDTHHVLRYVGSDGRDLSTAPLNANYPTLTTSPVSLGAHAWPYQGPESAGARVASRLPRAFAAQVSQIIVDAQGDVTLQMTTPVRFFLGPATDLDEKFVAVASALAHATLAPGDLVDVTTPSELSVTGPSSS